MADKYRVVGLLIDRRDFVPEDIVNQHLPFAPPRDTLVEAVYVREWKDEDDGAEIQGELQ